MRLLKILNLVVVLAVLPQPMPQAPAQPEFDVVIYGATSAGVIAAVQARRLGKTVVIVGPDFHLGGLSSGGLGFTDTGNKAVIGGNAFITFSVPPGARVGIGT